jgi:hypothetical protein
MESPSGFVGRFKPTQGPVFSSVILLLRFVLGDTTPSKFVKPNFELIRGQITDVSIMRNIKNFIRKDRLPSLNQKYICISIPINLLRLLESIHEDVGVRTLSRKS